MSVSVITGILHRIKWSSQEEGNDYVIAELRTGETIKGNLPENQRVIGLTFLFQGQWRDDKPYQGKAQKSFNFTIAKQAEASTRQGMVAYIEKFAPGIGPSIAGQLWDAFGSDAARILRTTPEIAADRIPRLRPEVATEAAKELQKNVKYEECRIALAELFAGRGFSSNLPNICIERWGIAAANRIRRDPFALLAAGMPSVGFARCDQLYLSLGLNPLKLKRLMFCTWNTIRTERDGSTWYSYRELTIKVGQAMSFGGDITDRNDRITKAVTLGVRAKWLALHRDSAGQIWLSDWTSGENERRIASHIERLTWIPKEPDRNEDSVEQTMVAECGMECEIESTSQLDPDELTESEINQKITDGRRFGICQFCHRELRNNESRRLGYGPICAKRHNLPWGEDAEEAIAVNLQNIAIHSH